MAKKAKKSAAKAESKPVDVIEEIVTALGKNAPKKEKGNAYLRAIIYAVADENKFSDAQYDGLSKASQEWLQQAETVLQKDDKADVPAPGAAAEPDDGEAAEDGDEGDEGEDGDGEDEPAPAKKSKDKSKSKAKKVEKKVEAEPEPPKAKAKKGKKVPINIAKSVKKKSEPKATKSDAEIAAAVAFAKKMEDKGPCSVVRAVADKYKTFERADVLAVADALKINKYTASRQFQVARSGGK